MRYKRAKRFQEIYECTSCKQTKVFYRKEKQAREKGHLKKLWCVRCIREINHKKVVYDDVLREKFLRRFKEN